MDRQAQLDRFRTGFDDVVDALSAITPDELDRRPPGSDWSAREIAHHVADNEATAYVRLRRLIAVDNRSGTHSVAGPYSVAGWLRTYAGHSHDHADQIRRARRGEA